VGSFRLSFEIGECDIYFLPKVSNTASIPNVK
jgi:hypothetical protein